MEKRMDVLNMILIALGCFILTVFLTGTIIFILMKMFEEQIENCGNEECKKK